MLKEEFCKKWLSVFGKGLSTKDILRVHADNYIWHIFSFELINKNIFLCGDNARNAFDKMVKFSKKDNSPLVDTLLFFENKETYPINEKCDTSKKVENLLEFYAVEKNFKWTYIVTHETGMGLGPYFMAIK